MDIAKYIEHTLLKPGATEADIKKLVDEAFEYKFFGVCINPNFVKFTRKYIDETKAGLASKGVVPHDVKLVTVVNFPLGTNSMDTTLVQVHEALNEGADEIDTVINLSAIKMGDYKQVSDEIKTTKGVCGKHNLKVILEVDLLTRDEIKKACLNCITAGADFVKTSTGFLKEGLGATTENIRLMSETVSRRGIGVKASGGIRTRVQAIDLINAGADRLGTSSGVAIVKY